MAGSILEGGRLEDGNVRTAPSESAGVDLRLPLSSARSLRLLRQGKGHSEWKDSSEEDKASLRPSSSPSSSLSSPSASRHLSLTSHWSW